MKSMDRSARLDVYTRILMKANETMRIDDAHKVATDVLELEDEVTALGMALTKYVSAFPFLNMMYLEFPFSFQRCHPIM